MEDRECLKILKDRGCPERVIEHILAVRDVAMRIAGEVKIDVNLDLIRMGAFFHDIGRSKSHGIEHAVLGAEIAREAGLDESIVRIVERHLGAGITEEEAKSLGLPAKSYMPETAEEKIVSYADTLISGNREISFEASLDKVKKIIGSDHPAIERYWALHREVEGWMSI